MKELVGAALLCLGVATQPTLAMSTALEVEHPTILDRADRFVVAEVVSVLPPEPFFAGETYRYRIRIVAVLGGEPGPAEPEVWFSHYRPHQRGAQFVHPLYVDGSGSGSERSLAPAQRYLMFTHGNPDSATAELVRAEALAEQPRLLAAWHKKLVFEGTVESVRALPADDASKRPALRWRVQTKVDKVLIGTFSSAHFQFRVHSPARSGLTPGRRITVRAVRTPDGYHVDPDQWNP